MGFEVLGGYLFPGKGMASNRLHPTQWANLNPRLGFAYQINEKTLIRGGYWVLFDAAIYGAAGRLGSGTVFNAGTQWLPTLDGVTPFLNMSDPFPTGSTSQRGYQRRRGGLGPGCFPGAVPIQHARPL